MLCKLTPEEEVRMHILLKGITDDPNALEMQKFIQHGSVTTYEHCLRVTRIAFWLNIHLHARADEASLVKGAFLHDFYLYYVLRCGFGPAKIYRLAKAAFAGRAEYTDAVLYKWLRNFYWRFFAQQFKRSCLPDGPKVGSVTLSPRGDWRMPSDACATLWLAELEQLKPGEQ